jgi:succinate-acetate transporter protein
MFLPGSGFLAAAVAAGQLEQCLGLFSISYAIAALIFFMGTFRQPILVRIILGFTFLSFLFSAIGAFTGVVAISKAGGWFSVILGLTAWYTLMCLIYNEHNTFIRLPMF